MKVTLWDKEVDLDFPNANSFLSYSEIEELEQPLSSFKQEHVWISSVFKEKWLHCRKFLPPDYAAPEAIIVYCHGIQAHSGRALEVKGQKLGLALLVEHYVERHGFALYAMDLLGHGYSEGDRAYIPQYQIHMQDMQEWAMVARENHPHVPLFFMGHSYGATLCLQVTVHYRWKEYPEFGGLILLTTDAQEPLPYPLVVAPFLTSVLAKCLPKSRPFFMSHSVSPHRIWSDPKVLALQRTNPSLWDKIETPGMTVQLGTASQLLQSTEHLRTITIPRLKSPFLVIHGTMSALDESNRRGGDSGSGSGRVPSTKADHDDDIILDCLEKYAKTPKEHQTRVWVECACHDLLCDRSRVQYVLQHLDTFLGKQMTLLHDHLAETLRR